MLDGRLVVVVTLVELELLWLTCGEDIELWLALEVLLGRVTCGVEALVLRLTVAGAAVLFERETAAVWLLLLVLPP